MTQRKKIEETPKMSKDTNELKDNTFDEKLTLCGHCHKMTRGAPTCGECGGWREDNTSDELGDVIMELFKRDPTIHLDTMPNGDLIEPQCIQDITALITQKINEAERRGRIKENSWWKDRTVAISNGDIRTTIWSRRFEERAAELQSTQNGG